MSEVKCQLNNYTADVTIDTGSEITVTEERFWSLNDSVRFMLNSYQ